MTIKEKYNAWTRDTILVWALVRLCEKVKEKRKLLHVQEKASGMSKAKTRTKLVVIDRAALRKQVSQVARKGTPKKNSRGNNP
jgi:hypothetical protein